jgi:hypothetical protein
VDTGSPTGVLVALMAELVATFSLKMKFKGPAARSSPVNAWIFTAILLQA